MIVASRDGETNSKFKRRVMLEKREPLGMSKEPWKDKKQLITPRFSNMELKIYN